ncbi:techylectin-5B-like [Saccostrea cucullata]|uniref:techylectin-5B-like n=1 Tax=Saccostrea cuccullata TaxID=36930 RepID=UPI002ED2EEF5
MKFCHSVYLKSRGGQDSPAYSCILDANIGNISPFENGSWVHGQFHIGHQLDVDVKSNSPQVSVVVQGYDLYRHKHSTIGQFKTYKISFKGNDVIYELTKNKDQELRVELQRFNGDKAFAQYKTFYVRSEGSKYRLSVSGYSGTAGDSLTSVHNGMKLSTKDQDNDSSGHNCATKYHGAWWYHSCHYSNLNGLYGQSGVFGGKYPVLYHWKRNEEALQKTMMMIRHKN